MSERLEDFGSGTEIVLVTFTDAANLEPYRTANRLGFSILLDPERRGYRAFGLGRGSFMRIYGWRALTRYVQLFGRSRRTDTSFALHKPTDDTLQLGGDFVVGPDGRLRWGFWGQGPDDRPSVDALVSAVRAISDAGRGGQG